MEKNRFQGFTLVELLIVVAIIGILVAIAIPNLLEAQVRTKVATTHAEQRTLAGALEFYRTDHSDYPPALNAFMRPGSITETWRLTTPIDYLSSIPMDTFFSPQFFGQPGGVFGPGGPYMHYIADPVVTEFWLLWSYGPDRKMEFYEVTYDPTNGTVSDGDIYKVGERK